MTNAQNDRLSPYQLAVLDELLERQAEISTTRAPGVPTVATSQDRGLGTASPRPRGRRIVVRSATAALAAAAVILAVVLVVPGGAGVTPKWELAGEVSPYWQEATGPLSYDALLSLTCPSTTTCYVTGVTGPASGVEVTHDGDKGWDQLPLPDLMVRAVACLGASTCSLVQATMTSPSRVSFSSTTDGGRRWASARAPDALAVAQQTSNCASDGSACGDVVIGPIGLSCTTPSSCVVVASSPPLPESLALPNVPARSVEFVTKDSGRTWKKVVLPSGFLAGQVKCFAWGSCISTNEQGPTARALYSTDGGIRWASARVPALSGFLGSLSCSGASSCMAVLFPPVGESGTPVAPRLVPLLVSKDGGRSWSRLAGLKLSSGKAVTSISCPTSSDCWASGDTWSTMAYGAPGLGPTGGMVASTTNGGDSWQTDQLPPSIQGVGAVSCPTSKACFALGWSGSSSVLLTYKG